MVFLDLPKIAWLMLVPPLWFLFRYAAARRREAMISFSGTHPLKSMEQEAQRRRRRWTVGCYCLAAVLLVMALARPAWTRVSVPAGGQGRDLLFLLDVSNSMLAEDLAPNRLERAKQAVLDCLESLDGDRVGLVIFAGSPSIVCPMTTDYGFFRRRLEEAGPENVSQGGTRIGDAIRKSVDKLLSENRKGLQDIILITDGGDQESRPEKAAAELEELGAFLVIIGVGNPRSGVPIPLKPEDRAGPGSAFMTYKGRPVLTRLESGPLQRMAKASRHGVYLNAGARAFELDEIYRRLVQHFEEKLRGDSESVMRYREEFQWFLGLALLLLCLPRLLTVGRFFYSAGVRPGTALLTIALLACGSEARAQEETVEDAPEVIQEPPVRRSAKGHYRKGRRFFQAQEYAKAIEAFRMALEHSRGDELRVAACYNLGNSYFKGAEMILPQDQVLSLNYFSLSTEAFRAVLDFDAANEDAAWNLELARTREKELLDALRSDREGESGESEDGEDQDQSEEGEPGEEGDEMEPGDEMEETEESGEGKPSDYSAGDLSLDLENQNMPPPMVDPEDIFEEDAENNALRQKKGSSKYQAVEKDW